MNQFNHANPNHIPITNNWPFIETQLTKEMSQMQIKENHNVSPQPQPQPHLLKFNFKRQMIYAMKLNLVDKPRSTSKLEWLVEYQDVFPEILQNYHHQGNLPVPLSVY